MHRFPEGTLTTPEIAIEAIEAYGDADDDAAECPALWQSLSSAAAKAAETEPPDWPKAKALWLVADACSLMLRGSSINEPFGPLAVFDQGRSATPEDFKQEDLKLLSEIAASAKRRVLRARLSDLAWLCMKPKQIADAYRAIDAYTEQRPSQDNWVRSLEEWQRAITLCMQMGKAGRDRLQAIEAVLVATAEVEIPAEGGFGQRLAKVLFERRLGTDLGEKFPDLLATKGARMVTAGDWLWARSYLGLASDWYAKLGNDGRAADMTLAMALSWENETDQRIASDLHAGHLVAGTFLESAIQTLRKIPGEQREARGVDAHIARLLTRLGESGKLALKAMKRVSIDPIDISDLVAQSEQRVAGRPPLEALLSFAYLTPGPKVSKLAENAKKMMQEHPFSTLFSSSHYGRDGRVIAKTPGVDRPGEAIEQEGQLLATMLRHYLLEVELACRGQIYPALMAIEREHLIRRADLEQLLAQAPIVPPGRAEQFARGLWAGFEQDFATAIYLLAPQVEHLVRWHLKQAGVTTTTLDAEGIENEIGLSSLVDAPALKQVFDEDQLFELRSLFCSALGPNLRNQVAHGLLNQDECNTAPSIYAWWWVLGLTLRSFYLAIRAQHTALSAPAPSP